VFIRVITHFSKSLGKHESRLIGLDDVGIVWSFPDFAVIIIIDFSISLDSGQVCDGIEKLGDSANSAIWELDDDFGS